MNTKSWNVKEINRNGIFMPFRATLRTVAVSCLLIVGCFQAGVAFSFEIDKEIPYRIYIGSDKNIDWIDVISVGYMFDGEYHTLFEDKSPIQKVYLDENMMGEKFYWIIKENSIWKFFDYGIDSTLHLVEPVIPKDQNPILIYER